MEDIQLVIFLLEKEEYALDISRVQEIIRLFKITRVPHVPQSIEGVINLRGNIIPVMDLRKRFGFGPRIVTEDTRIIIIRFEGKKIGLIVDNVLEVVRIEPEKIELPPVINDKVNTEFLEGVINLDDRLLIILNLTKVIDAYNFSAQ